MDSLATDIKKKANIAANNDNDTKDDDTKADKGNKEGEGEESVFPIVADEWCANCHKEPCGEGIGGPSVTLKKCSACKLVKYCSVDCQRKHYKKKHKAECQALKKAREDGLFDEPPEESIEECNICFLPMPTETIDRAYHPCCGKSVCGGCYWGNKVAISEENLMIDEMARRYGNPDPTFRVYTCAYCRSDPVQGNNEKMKMYMARIEKYDDPKALQEIGIQCLNPSNKFGLPFDGDRALEFITRAAELGNDNSHSLLGVWYLYGKEGIVQQDKKKALAHSKIAAKLGHAPSHYHLGMLQVLYHKNFTSASKHMEIAAAMGNEESLNRLKDMANEAVIPISTYQRALVLYQKYQKKTSSENRDAWKKSKERREQIELLETTGNLRVS